MGYSLHRFRISVDHAKLPTGYPIGAYRPSTAFGIEGKPPSSPSYTSPEADLISADPPPEASNVREAR